MKTTISIAIIVLSSLGLWAQSACNNYFPMEEGATFQYTTFDKKGKMEAKADYTVTEVETVEAGTQATLSINFKDKKEKEVMTSSYRYTCAGDRIIVDYQSLFPSEMLEQYSNMDVDMSFTGTDIEIPNTLSVGQELEDANVTMNFSAAGMTMKTTVDMINRKVEKKESVTTPAGTFDCYVIYNDTEAKVMMSKNRSSSRMWLAENIGMVKQEMYNKGGKTISTTELTSYTQ
ncbi:TapB family protein [Croceiramulus getboli]|nr:hypothetical protein P8624_02495 [Flavobacteriaceae bacterium YJPT1-3]